MVGRGNDKLFGMELTISFFGVISRSAAHKWASPKKKQMEEKSEMVIASQPV